MKYIKKIKTVDVFETTQTTLDLPNVNLIEETYEVNYLPYVETPIETRLICKYNIDDIGTVYILNDADNFSSMEVDGIETEVNHEYDFDTIGEHVIKFTLIDTTTIGNDAFSGISNLVEVIIPDSVTYIGDWTFDECNNITSVTLGRNVNDIDISGLFICPNISTINISNDNNYYSIHDNVLYNKDYTSLILLYPKTFQGSFVIPNNITSINSSAFSSCSGITSISFSNNLKKIGNAAFSDCTNLTNVTIPDGVLTIDSSVFSGCSNLLSITIPNTVTSFGNAIFKECSNLVNVTLPSGITSIGEQMFQNCRNLTSITIPNGVTSIHALAFQDCRNLTSITIPNGVTYIGQAAFCRCYKLTSIEIPSSITYIGGTAFQYCDIIESITINATIPPTIAKTTFYSTNNCPIYVPAESVDLYKAASGWSEYASRIQAIQ